MGTFVPRVQEVSWSSNPGKAKSYAAFTLNGFDDQKRKLPFVNTDFQVLKLKFYACNFKQAFYPLHRLYESRDLKTQK